MDNLICTYEGGPKYSDKEILRSSDSFKVKSKETETELKFDGINTCAIPLSKFNLTVNDFSHIPINKLGLKTIAKYWINELMVTANGLLVMYSHDIPSLRGLPSVIYPISGPSVLENGNVLVPKFSLYNKQEYSALVLVALQASFNTNCAETYTLATQLDTSVFRNYAIEDEVGFCNNFNSLHNSSKFMFIYPTVVAKDLSRYSELVGDSEVQYIELGNNF